jgi:hypothetical protein
MCSRFGCRRATAWTMLGLYVLIASGLPLPIGGLSSDSKLAGTLAAKDRSRPFPCMNKPCGCRSATQCFTNCCCHTPAETLAWARARGIEPAVLSALERRASVLPVADPPAACSGDHGNCSAPEASSACLPPDDSTAPDDVVCSDYQSLAADPVDPSPPAGPDRLWAKSAAAGCGDRQARTPSAFSGVAHVGRHRPPSRAGHGRLFPRKAEPESTDRPPAAAADVVILRAVLACGGIVTQWTAVSTGLPPPAIVACILPEPQVGVVRLTNERALSRGGPPDTPPPKA